MKNHSCKKLVSLLLALVLCISVVSPATIFATDLEPVCITEDGAAFGPLPEVMSIAEGNSGIATYSSNGWVNNAIPESEMASLLNNEPLHPQRTGWMELDQLIENLLANAGENADTYTKLRYAYDYLVKNVMYSWYGYSYTNASLAAYNSFTGLNYLSSMTYEDGLQKSIPDDMANRTYHILSAKQGVCYDYAIAIAVIARYIGIESYVHTGLFIFEPAYGGIYGHHGWALLVIGGETYVFDPQRDARHYQYTGNNGYYFGIPQAVALDQSQYPHYRPNGFDADRQENPVRDSSLLPVTAERTHKVMVSVQSSDGGNIQGSGGYITGETATLTAIPNSGYVFTGWYNSQGQLLSDQKTYTFPVSDNITLEAKFARTYKITLKSSRSGIAHGEGTYLEGSITVSAESEKAPFQGWYSTNGTLVNTDADYVFTPTKNTTLIAMFQGDTFYDLPENEYYTPYVMEATQRSLILGMSPIEFAPDTIMTRAMLVQVLANLENADTSTAPASPFVDVPSTSWYYSVINWGYAQGLVLGMDTTHFAPDDPITREQFLTILVRYLENKGYTLSETDLNYTDSAKFSNYALPYARKAQATELILGYEDNSFRPQNELPRREGVTILVRMARYLENTPLA